MVGQHINSAISVGGGGPPPAKPFPEPSKPKIGESLKGPSIRAPSPARHEMKDKEDQQRRILVDACAVEESLIARNKLAEFKPSKETLKYLAKNDVRPLKKVNHGKQYFSQHCHNYRIVFVMPTAPQT